MSDRSAWTWRHSIIESDLPATTRHVLLTLSCHISDSGRAVAVTVAELVRHTGLSKPAVMTHLKAAEVSGWISVQKHGLAGQRWNANEYQITVPGTESVPALPPKGGQRGLPKVVNVIAQRKPSLVNVVDQKAVNDVDRLYSSSFIPPVVPQVSGFDRFWAAYPSNRRLAKAKCQRFWHRHNVEPLTDQVLSGLDAWKRDEQWQRDSGRFIPHAATFLNQQRWLSDSLPQSAAVPAAQSLPEKVCACSAPGIFLVGRKWLCRQCDRERQEAMA